MELISGICSVIVAISSAAILVLGIVWVVMAAKKREGRRKTGRRLLIALGCFVVFTMIGAYADPATHCDHDFQFVESEAATCEKDGYEKFYCDLCGRDKTEKLEKLGHDMVDDHRTEPTEDADGEYVRKCSRCGYEEIEVLKKLETPTETKKPTETEEPTEDVPLSISFDEIYKAYKENELVADDLYQYNRYRITAKINNMSTDGLFNLTGGATLTMERRVGNTRVFFYAEFEKEQEEALKTIKVGDTITFEGECLSAGMWSDCELITE